jgi:hypothetical protein
LLSKFDLYRYGAVHRGVAEAWDAISHLAVDTVRDAVGKLGVKRVVGLYKLNELS